MRVKVLLSGAIAIAFALVGGRLAIQETSTRDNERLDSLQLLVDGIARDASGLLALSQDYVLHESPRAARQWRVMHAALAGALPQVAQQNESLVDEVQDLENAANALPALFDAVEATAGDAADPARVQARRELLAGHLVAETRRITDGAFVLTERLVDLRRARTHIDRRVTQATMVAFTALVLLLSVFVGRRVLRPLAGLERAAQAVRAGNLTTRSDYRAPDEFGLLSTSFDTMARTLQERTASLEQARLDLKRTLDAIPSVIAYWDASLVNGYANQAYGDWFGIAPERLPGLHMRDVLGDQFEFSLPYMAAVLRGEPQAFERSLKRLDGTGLRHTISHYVPDQVDGHVRGFYCCIHDITQQTVDRTRLAAALRENDALLSTIRTQTICSVAGRDGRIVEVNDYFCRISGYSRGELIGQDHRIVNSGTHDKSFWSDMWRTIGAGRPWRGEICNRARDGTLYWVDSIVAPFADADGRIEKYISIRTDITAAKQADARLRASEDFLSRTGRVAGVGGWQVDLRRNDLVWSAETRRIHEVPPDYVPDLGTAIGFYDPAGRPTIEAAVQRGMASGEPWDLELPLTTAQGRSIWVRAVGEVEFTDGQPTRLFGAVQDITERKQLERRLADGERFLRQITDGLPLRIAYVDPQLRYRFVNQAHCRRFGLERDEILGRRREELTRGDSNAEAAERIREALAGDPQRFEYEETIAGELRCIESRLIPDIRADGTVQGVFTTGMDITERKRAEVELQQTSARLRTVLESASEVSVIATDPDLTIRVFNAGAERLLGYRSTEVVGRMTPVPIHDAQEVEDRARELSAQLGRPIEGGAVFTEPSTFRQPRPWTYVRKNGTRVAVSLVVTPMHTDAGDLIGYLGVAHDVTRQQAYEESLRVAMHKARQANLAKSQFLANMSHEIRTPMNAVIGLTYLLGQTALDDEQAQFLAKIKTASKSLLALINDVLDLSKVEAGELTIERAPFNLRHLLKELAELAGVQADAKHVGFELDAPADLPVWLVGDAARLTQIVTNLLSNAVKFTERGGVALRVRQTQATAEAATLRFEVRDTGIGIEPETQARLFAPFVQADVSITRRFGGTGLGLSIVRTLTDLMGGRIEVRSTPGVGSEFCIELGFPLPPPEATAAQAAAAPAPGERALRGVRVLIVDDSDINLDVAQRILELESARVALARNGEEACNALRVRPDGYDVVLMDVQMPVLDGYEATRRIRVDLGLKALPIVALTAGALTSEKQRAEAVGMSDFVTKPFDPRALVRTVRRHARADAGEQPTATPAAAPVDGEPWTEIDGIDTDDVRARLGGDRKLFRAMLGRLLDEFGDLDVPADTAHAPIGVHAGRMHKLRGSSGLLGAKLIQALAGEAEAACRADDTRLAIGLMRRLARQLQRLKQAAAPVLDAPRTDFDDGMPASADEPLDTQAVAELAGLLRQQSLSALERFHGATRTLMRLLGKSDYEKVRKQIDDLQFDAAAQLIEEHAQRV